MPYEIPPQSVLEVRILGWLFDQRVMNVFHYKNTDSYVDGRAALVAFVNNEILGAAKLYDKLQGIMSEDVGLLFIQAQWIWPTRYAYVTVTPVVRSGGIAESSLPPNVAVTLTKRGDVANRHNIGSTHVAGIPFTAQEGGNVAGGYYETLLDLASEIQATYGIGEQLYPVIYNRGAPGDSVQITGVLPQETMRVERRRTVGLGE